MAFRFRPLSPSRCMAILCPAIGRSISAGTNIFDAWSSSEECRCLDAPKLFSASWLLPAGAARATDAATCDAYAKEASAKAEGIRKFNCGYEKYPFETEHRRRLHGESERNSPHGQYFYGQDLCRLHCRDHGFPVADPARCCGERGHTLVQQFCDACGQQRGSGPEDGRLRPQPFG